MSADVWSPWKPEIGQHVRLRISPECPFCESSSGNADNLRHIDDSGRIGTVMHSGPPYPGVTKELPAKHHPYQVSFDDPIVLSTGGRCVGGFYAINELEPIDG